MRPWTQAVGALILAAAVVVAVVVLLGTFHDQVGAAVSASLCATLGIVIGIISIINRVTLEVDTQQVSLGFWPIWKVRSWLELGEVRHRQSLQQCSR